MGVCFSKNKEENRISKKEKKADVSEVEREKRISKKEKKNRISKKEKKADVSEVEREKSLTNKNEEIKVLNLREEISNGTPHKFVMSDQNLSNELIEVSVDRSFHENKSNENKFDENKFDENKFDENKFDENKFDEIKFDENKFDENKFDEIKSPRINSENIILKNRESRAIFFASFWETKSKQNPISKINKKVIIKLTVVEKNIINKFIQEIINIILERTFIEIKNKANNLAAEILDTILSEIILEIAEKKMHDETVNELIKDVLSNAIYTVNWKPLGFANPKGYCYLNSVVQVLGSCEEFKKDIDLYNLNTTEKTKDSIFVEGLFNLIKAIREYNKENLNKSLDIVQQNITESSFGDDVYKCFMNLLTRVSNVIKTNIDRPSDHFTSLPITLSEKAQTTFAKFKNRNPGFVFDNFYGQLTFQTVCKICDHVCNESFQMIKSLPLPVPNSNTSATLNSCVDLFFNESDVEVDEPMKCNCVGGSMSLKSISKLTHGPKYLFIYLNRGSYTDDGVKNNTHVICDGLTIDIKTLEDKSIKYNLISVIDHVGDSSYGHYYCKCSFESEEWWLLNDSQVKRIKDKNDIVTKNTIVFFFKITP